VQYIYRNLIATAILDVLCILQTFFSISSCVCTCVSTKRCFGSFLTHSYYTSDCQLLDISTPRFGPDVKPPLPPPLNFPSSWATYTHLKSRNFRYSPKTHVNLVAATAVRGPDILFALVYVLMSCAQAEVCAHCAEAFLHFIVITITTVRPVSYSEFCL
jgi:hypothetical protein